MMFESNKRRSLPSLAHGGKIWAEKNTPAGSLFLFTIPLAASSKGALPATDVASGGSGWRITGAFEKIGEIADEVPSVLVVEDDLDLAGVMVTALQSHEISTFHASSGGEAVRLCREHKPSLIVLDSSFPTWTVLRSSALCERLPAFDGCLFSCTRRSMSEAPASHAFASGGRSF